MFRAIIPSMNQWLALTRALDRTMADHVPDWTSHTDSDPGITLLELMAFLAEQPLYHGVGKRGAAEVSRIVRALERLRHDDTTPSSASVLVHDQWSGTLRPRFFAGRMLTSDDLNEEQQYDRDKWRRHLRMLHGSGIVSGLDVEPGAAAGTIVVQPGYAIDARGQEIIVNEQVTLTVPSGSPSMVCVSLQYVERRAAPVPVSTGGDTEASRVEEGCRIVLSADRREPGIVLACLIREKNVWRIDHSSPRPTLRPMAHHHGARGPSDAE